MISLCDIDSRSIDEIWNHSINEKQCLDTLKIGCESLDSALGGILAGEIIEFYGDSACGKTQISLTIIANTLIEDYLSKSEIRKVILIYTHSVPPIDRIKSIISNRLKLLAPIEDSNHVADLLLEHLLISTPRDYREMYKLLTEDIFTIGVSNVKYPNLLIIDSISLIRRIEHKECVKRHNELIRSVSRHLKKFAHERNSAIVVTNQVQAISKFNIFSVKNPVLGLYWTRSINTRVYIQQYQMYNYQFSEVSKKLATIIFSTRPLPNQRNAIIFTIGPTGVEHCQPEL